MKKVPTWYHKTFDEHGVIRKTKVHMWIVWILFHKPYFTTGDMKKEKVQVPQQNEMLSLYCIALCFISKNEEYNQK